MGMVTPHGPDLPAFWRKCVEGRSSVSRNDLFAIPDHISQAVGMVRGFEPASLDIYDNSQTDDRALLFGVSAMREALTDAGLFKNGLVDGSSGGVDPHRCALHLSSAVGQISSMERHFCRQTDAGRNGLKPSRQQLPGSNPFRFGSLSTELGSRFGLGGFKMLIPTGCAGGMDAMASAIYAIRRGHADVVVAGAAEAPITPLVVAAFNRIGATSKRNHEPERASRPFDRDRDGFVLGEGGGILVLEDLDHALARGARIHAELTGIGSVNNYTHMTDIPETGWSIALSTEWALRDAGIAPDRIDFINAHGSSTPQNDTAETNAFYSVFGERAATIPVTSIKSQIGHSLAASNAIEVISSVLAIRDDILPPTINLKHQDERCRLDVVANTARRRRVDCILKTSSGFSGIHSSMIIQRYTEH
jgi:3-oxoacyl-(acyl-carrier-protein) synthase